jgi:hypothetical protein
MTIRQGALADGQQVPPWSECHSVKSSGRRSTQRFADHPIHPGGTSAALQEIEARVNG